MTTRASIACVGFVALLVSYSSVTVTTAEAMNSTSKIASASLGYGTTNASFSECLEDVEYCEHSSCVECYSEIESSTDYTRFAEYPEYIECIWEIYKEPTTVSLCDIYRGHSCCSSKLYDWECYYEVNLMTIYNCYLDYYECSSEYYSCVEGAVGKGSTSNDAAAMTGNGQLSRLVFSAVLVFTIVIAMGV